MVKTGTGRGGNRKAAGRPPGAHNKRTRAIAEALAKDGNLTPLEFMLKVMRDEKQDLDTRLDMAKAAAPYMHPRLNAIQHTGKDGEPIAVTFTAIDAGAL